MYKNAVRNKWRWLSRRGPCSVEDLWDLSLVDLDSLYKAMNRQIKEMSEDSLLVKASRENETLQAQRAIVKDIVETKLAEADARKNETLKASLRQRLLGIKAEKQNEEYSKMDMDELDAQIEALS